MTEQEKFEKLIDALGISVYQFGKDLGFVRVEPIYKILRGDTKDPGSSIYGKIKKAYPNVSLEWLVTGEGDVFVKEAVAQNNELQEKINQLESENRFLQTMYENAVISKAASLGKSEGAILCPDMTRVIRKRMTADTMKLPRARRTSRSISVRVPGVGIPNIMDQVRDILG